MSLKDLTAEMEFELTSTTKLLERLPEGRLTWKPNEKAMTLGQLAFHVATIPGNYLTYADDGKTDLAVLTYHHIPESKTGIMDSFAAGTAKAKHVLAKATEDWGAENWELIKNGETIFTIPRGLMCRLLVFNHWYHHRGELVTYLRTMGALIPSIYGPSADEDPFA